MTGLGSRLGALLARETVLAWGRGGGPLVSVGFYAGVATLLPLAIGPEPARLAAVAPGAAWVALALASLLSLDRLFERDGGRFGGLGRAAAPDAPEHKLLAGGPRRLQPVLMAHQMQARAARLARVGAAEGDLAGLQRHEPRHGAQQAGLARPVGAGQGAGLAGFQPQRQVGKQRAPAAAHGHAVELKAGDHARASARPKLEPGRPWTRETPRSM